MAKVYTHTYDYTKFDYCYDSVAQFERDAADYLEGTTADDVGAVVLYYDANGNEVAYYDYENYVGSVYALGGTTACYMPE